jgi:uncharacterized membrane protein
MGGELSSPPSPSPNAAGANEAKLVCPHCGTEMPPNAAFCPACGWSMKPIAAVDRALAALAYLTLIPAATLLFLPAYRSHRFIRFHAWQSVLLWIVFLVLTVLALVFSNITAALMFLLLGVLAALAMFFLWVVLTIKAWQGERFALPVFGVLAGRLS